MITTEVFTEANRMSRLSHDSDAKSNADAIAGATSPFDDMTLSIFDTAEIINGFDIGQIRATHETRNQIIGLCLHVCLILVFLFFSFIATLYTIGQLYSIELSNFWCDEEYTLAEIHARNREERIADGEGWSCWIVGGFVNRDALLTPHVTDAYTSTSLAFNDDFTNNRAVFFVLYGLVAIGFIICIVIQLYRFWCKNKMENCTKLCQKHDIEKMKEKIKNKLNMKKRNSKIPKLYDNDNNNNDNNRQRKRKRKRKGRRQRNHAKNKQQKQRKKNGKHSRTSLMNFNEIDWNQYDCCGKISIFWLVFVNKIQYLNDERKHYSSIFMAVDTPYFVISKIVFEFFEIYVQLLVLFNYGGTSLTHALFGWNDDTLYLGEEFKFTDNFSYVILCNALVTGLLWCLYAILPNKMYGYPFYNMLFFIDGLFDAIYILYPFWIVTDGMENTDLLRFIGILGIDTSNQFISSFLPLCFMVKRCWFGLEHSGKLALNIALDDDYTDQKNLIKKRKQVLQSIEKIQRIQSLTKQLELEQKARSQSEQHQQIPPQTQGHVQPQQCDSNDKMTVEMVAYHNIPHSKSPTKGQEFGHGLTDEMKSIAMQVNQPPMTNTSAATISTPLEIGLPTTTDEKEEILAYQPSKLIMHHESDGYDTASEKETVTSGNKTGSKLHPIVGPVTFDQILQTQQGIEINNNYKYNYNSVAPSGDILNRDRIATLSSVSNHNRDIIVRDRSTTRDRDDDGDDIARKSAIKDRFSSIAHRRKKLLCIYHGTKKHKTNARKKRRNIIARVCVIFVALCMVSICMGICIAVINNLEKSRKFCYDFTYSNWVENDWSNEDTPSYIKDHPQTILWDETCDTKVVRLFEDYPCNCRYAKYFPQQRNSILCEVFDSEGKTIANFTLGDIITLMLSGMYKFIENCFCYCELCVANCMCALQIQ